MCSDQGQPNKGIKKEPAGFLLLALKGKDVTAIILVGMLYETCNLACPTMDFKIWKTVRIAEATDVHEAARETWRFFHPRHFLTVHDYVRAEMHDTETRKTWTVNDKGHSQRDYRTEETDDFKRRYTK